MVKPQLSNCSEKLGIVIHDPKIHGLTDVQITILTSAKGHKHIYTS